MKGSKRKGNKMRRDQIAGAVELGRRMKLKRKIMRVKIPISVE